MVKQKKLKQGQIKTVSVLLLGQKLSEIMAEDKAPRIMMISLSSNSKVHFQKQK